MNKYINKQVLRSLIEEQAEMASEVPKAVLLSVVKTIDLLQDADVVEVKHGTWEPVGFDEEGYAIHKCSICGIKQLPYTEYCPECGANMYK